MTETADIHISRSLIPAIFGTNDRNLKHIMNVLEVKIASLGDIVRIEGKKKNISEARKLLEHLVKVASKKDLNFDDVKDAIKMITENLREDISSVMLQSIKVSGRVKSVTPKSPRQKDYVTAIAKNDLVFGIGPAGTGKTYLAMAMGVHLFLQKKIGRIILTRPAVEAGENLGFLPGDIADKINPYLRPLYDALYAMMDTELVVSLMEKNVIEVAPLAFMRGRTLNDSFIILDEAQNTTEEQMKMFLTRIGFQSKVVVTGDITQVDLPTNKRSGLMKAREILQGIKHIKFIEFNDKDVVRHPLVQKIILAYERSESGANR